MPKQRKLTLTIEEREALIDHRDHDTRPQVRERCAAVLKVAEGQPANWIAQHGLLKVCLVETVYNGLNIYEAEGLDGLIVRLYGGNRWRGF